MIVLLGASGYIGALADSLRRWQPEKS